MPSRVRADERVVSEAADVVYHVLVGLRLRGIPFRQVLAELARASAGADTMKRLRR